jgi:hypothetical protein
MEIIIEKIVKQTIIFKENAILDVMDSWGCDADKAIDAIINDIDKEELDYQENEEVIKKEIIVKK